MKVSKEILIDFYLNKRKSVNEISKILNKSETSINYWMRKFKIKKRSLSEAMYLKYNPNGDPFLIKKPCNIKQAILYGIGIGLYWGEGTKSNKYSIRLGNTDPKLIKKFIDFLEEIYGIDRKRLKFGLQIFSDMSKRLVLNFWKKELNIPTNQFYKIIVTPSRSLGTYRNKTKYGVVTVYYNNKKLRDIICADIENI